MQLGRDYRATILIADDEASLRSAIVIMLEGAGYQTVEADDGLKALAAFEQTKPDLVVLDVAMPKLSGYDVCSIIRKVAPHVPVIFLTARNDIEDKITGFHSGGNDYLTKPFDSRELLVRIQSLLHMAITTPRNIGSLIVVGDLQVDLVRREVTVRGEPVQLTPTEYDIVALMARNEGRVFSKLEIIDEIWGCEYRSSSISIPSFIRHIREKIEDDPADPRYLKTIRRMGYRFGD